MLEPDLIEIFVGPLNLLGIRYLVSGSVAAMLYGEPRVTHDIDLVVFLRHNDIARLSTAFPTPQFYVPPAEVISAEILRERGSFNIIHADSGLKADLYTVNRDEMDAWAFRNAKKYPIKRKTITLAPAEYVVLRKLEFYREGGSDKHVRDILPCSLFREIKSISQNFTNGSNAAVCKSNGRRSKAALSRDSH